MKRFLVTSQYGFLFPVDANSEDELRENPRPEWSESFTIEDQGEVDPVQEKALEECLIRRGQQYPPLAEFADAFVKMQDGNPQQMEAYIEKCLEVKKNNPKPGAQPDDGWNNKSIWERFKAAMIG